MTWRPEPQPACPCGQPIPLDGLSLDYCSHSCQYLYMAIGFDREPAPAKPEWRHSLRACDCGPREVCQRCGPGAPPMTDPEVRQWIEDRDPAPVEAPPEVTTQDLADFANSDLVREAHQATQTAREATARTFGIPVEHVIGDGPGLRILSDPSDPGRSTRIRRILNATNKKASS